MKTKIITFWSPVKRQSGCSTNVALYASYLSNIMDETEKAIIFSLNSNVDAADYITPGPIRKGLEDLLLLSEINTVKAEDVLSYTHKVSENLDIIGTGKTKELIENRYLDIMDMLIATYDYVIVDTISDETSASTAVMNMSDLIVVSIPQDRYVYETLDFSKFENKKIVFLSSMYSDKNELSFNKIQAMLPAQVYTLSRDDKINQATYNQNIYSFIGKELKRKSKIISEIDDLHKEMTRLLHIEFLNISYELKKNKVSAAEVQNNIETKVIKEYKFIKTKNNIMVINLSQGAGSTFVALNLAYKLKERKVDVAVIELPRINMKADILNILSSEHEDYVSIAEAIKTDSVKGSPYIKNGIKFYVNNNMILEWSNNDNNEYLSCVCRENNINIYDFGSQEIDDSVGFLLNLIDVAIVIIDPVPYKLLQTEERIKMLNILENKNINVIFVLNKFIKDLNKKDIEKYLQVKISSCIPFLSPETMYASYYSNQVAYNFEKSELFHDSLSKILNSANIMVYEEKRERRKFKLFNWR